MPQRLILPIDWKGLNFYCFSPIHFWMCFCKMRERTTFRNQPSDLVRVSLGTLRNLCPHCRMEFGVQNSDINEGVLSVLFPLCCDDGVFISVQVLFPGTFSALSLLCPQIFNFIPFLFITAASTCSALSMSRMTIKPLYIY